MILPVLLPTAQALGSIRFISESWPSSTSARLVTPPYGLRFMMSRSPTFRCATSCAKCGVPLCDDRRVALITLVPEFVLYLPRLFGYRADQ